jgi:hypothetical protein
VNTYSIQHKLSTLSEIWDGPFEHAGFRFSQWHFTMAQGAVGSAWLAEATVTAATAIEALDDFRRRLGPVVDRIAFASQCHATFEVESFLVDRQNENTEHVFLVRCTKDRGGVPLHFGQDERATLAALDQYTEKGDVFRYLREAISSTTFYTRLAMFMAALEAAAGQRTNKKGSKAVDKEYMRRDILKDDALFERLYRYGAGIRNQMFHGAQVNFGPPPAGDTTLPEEIYAKLVSYYNEKHGAKINAAVRGAPRNPIGNFETLTLWLKPKGSNTSLVLREIEELVEKREDHQDPNGLRNRFESTKMPPGY